MHLGGEGILDFRKLLSKCFNLKIMAKANTTLAELEFETVRFN